MNLWVIDPKTKEPSVSLTLMIVSFLVLIIACGLNMANVIESTSSLTELFYANVGLYFGRKFTSAKGETIEGEGTTPTT